MESEQDGRCAHCGLPRTGYGGVDGKAVCHTSGRGMPDCYRRITIYGEPLGALRDYEPLPEGIKDIQGKSRWGHLNSVQIDMSHEMATSLIESIEVMGSRAPLPWKQLWTLIMAVRCGTCQVYGVALCPLHKGMFGEKDATLSDPGH